MLSRFYLNLREANSGSLADCELSDMSQVSDIQFDRVLGRLAGSIVYVTDDDPEEIGEVDVATDVDDDVDVEEVGSP